MALGLRVLEVQRVAQSLKRYIVGVLQVLHGLAQHLGAGADHLLEVLLVVVAVLQGLAMVKGALHGVDQVLALEGLEQVVVSAAAHGVNGNADVVDGGDHDDRKLRLLTMDALKEGDAVAVLHHDICEDQVKGIAFQDVQALAATGSQLHVVALALKSGTNHGADVRLVVNDQNAGDAARTRGGVLLCVGARTARRGHHLRSCQIKCQARTPPMKRSQNNSQGNSSSVNSCHLLALRNYAASPIKQAFVQICTGDAAKPSEYT
jgi:hypothetical protein